MALVILYGLLLLPEARPPSPKGAGQQAFLWNRNAFWSALEKQMQEARALDLTRRNTAILVALARVHSVLDALSVTNLPPTASAFDELETTFFLIAPKVAAGGARDSLTVFLETGAQLQRLVKRQSEHWPVDTRETRERIYRALYGSRAAVEEALLQLPRGQIPAITRGDDEPSATPSAMVQEVKLHSGDVLVSRGGAATSALIARGNDFPGNFSHIALAHVDEQTKQVSVIEAHIESGVGVRSIAAYLAETKLRIMLLRPRANLPALVADPLLPHKAASLALSNALARHIPYDFAMDHADPAKQFCSEVAAAAYQAFGVKLWSALSRLSTPGVTTWLAALGVRHFETQEPSDLEYDPQLRVVAEWRDPETLFKDHVDNAVIDAMLEGAERGDKLDYNHWLLPFARLAKVWSVMLNQFGKIGPIPEGMSATTALRVDRLKQDHAAIVARVMTAAEVFRTERGYAPPYWELVRLAREARTQPPSR
jgi:hypothetical protein